MSGATFEVVSDSVSVAKACLTSFSVITVLEEPEEEPAVEFTHQNFQCPYGCSADAATCPCGNYRCNTNKPTIDPKHMSTACMEVVKDYCESDAAQQDSGCEAQSGRKSMVKRVPRGQALVVEDDDSLPARGGRKMKLTFKAGSMEEEEDIGIADFAEDDVSSMDKPGGYENARILAPVVALTPHGITFPAQSCVDVEIPFDTTAGSGGGVLGRLHHSPHHPRISQAA